MTNIILINSSKPRVGKSVFASKLKTHLPNTQHLSFAGPIKDIFYFLYEHVSMKFDQVPTYSLEDYRQLKKDIPIQDGLFTTSPRDQYCSGSLFLSSITSEDVWGKLGLKNIEKAIQQGADTILFDDWRRPIESNTLRKNSSLNIITVYLDKEDVPAHVGTASTESFEGNILPSECDINFTFNKDWTNTEELIQMIEEKLKV